MATRNRSGTKAGSGTQPRASITFPSKLHRTVEDLAKRKQVSLAWIVREAAEKYVEAQWPQLSGLWQE